MIDRPEAVDPPIVDDAPSMEVPEKVRTGAYKKLDKQLTEFYQAIAVTVVSPIDALGGTLMFQRAPDLAGSWVDLAEQNPKVKATLERILEAGGVFGIITVHAAILMPVLVNRGMFADNVAGGIASFTLLQNPEVMPLFTHERFRQQESSPNGNGGSQ